MFKQELIDLIEKKRAELSLAVSSYGLNSDLAIQYSQELDQLLNKYNNLFVQNS